MCEIPWLFATLVLQEFQLFCIYLPSTFLSLALTGTENAKVNCRQAQEDTYFMSPLRERI